MRSLIRSAVFLPAFMALAAVGRAQVGSVLHEQKINEFAGGLSQALSRGDQFGSSLARLDDLNGDGIRELAVGMIGCDDGGTDRGAVWILFLRADGTVLGKTKISHTSGGFTGALVDAERFGTKLATLGDLDGDGLLELAVTSFLPRLRVLFLNRDGTVRAQTRILPTDPVFGGATRLFAFEFGGLGAVGDLDGDGTPDLAWGAPYEDAGAEDAGAVWILHMNPDGTAKSTRKIANRHGGFTGSLVADDYFGMAIRRLGDVNGDGHADLGVLDYEETGTLGRLWILFLDADSQVTGHRVIDGMDFRMESPITRVHGHLGYDLGILDDLDGDGIAEIAVSSFGYAGSGGVAIGFLARDGSLRKRVAIGNGRGGLPSGSNRRLFGWSLEWLGDLDGDGSGELAVGDVYDAQSGIAAGSVSVLSLDPDAVRNGSGINPLILTQSSEPVLGQSWSAKLGCGGRGGGVAYVAGYDRPLAGVRLREGELLVDALTGQRIFELVAAHAGAPIVLSGQVPNDIALMNLVIHVQGLCTGAAGSRLSNALDIQVGR